MLVFAGNSSAVADAKDVVQTKMTATIFKEFFLVIETLMPDPEERSQRRKLPIVKNSMTMTFPRDSSFTVAEALFSTAVLALEGCQPTQLQPFGKSIFEALCS